MNNEYLPIASYIWTIRYFRKDNEICIARHFYWRLCSTETVIVLICTNLSRKIIWFVDFFWNSFVDYTFAVYTIQIIIWSKAISIDLYHMAICFMLNALLFFQFVRTHFFTLSIFQCFAANSKWFIFSNQTNLELLGYTNRRQQQKQN